MSETEQKVHYGIGSAAAAAAIFAPLSYKWKGILTAIAAGTILRGIYDDRLSIARKRHASMSETEQKVRHGIGSAAAASAIFAPLSYKWKGILTAIAAETILTAIYEVAPERRLLHV
jgi:hypothetical protein